MQARLVAAALVLVPLASSCFVGRDTINEPLVKERIAKLVPGHSTATEVAQSLGAPNEVVQLGHGMAWRYDYTVAKRAAFSLIVVTFVNEDARADRAWLFFDADRKLTHVGSTLQAAHAEYAMPWEDVHE